MEKKLPKPIKTFIQILVVSAITISIDYLIVALTHDDSIWVGEAIEAVASIICGPVVGGVATFFNCILTDYFIYHSFDYIFMGPIEALAMFLIGVIYRRLNKDEDVFGLREIVVFNFVQVLVNTAVIYLSTPPAAILFFGFILENWSREDFVTESIALSNNALSACISVALIGTVLLYICTTIRKKVNEYGSISTALYSIVRPTFIKKQYRTRAVEYAIGFVFAIALTMVDGVVSGHVLGTDALAATSLMFPLISFSTFISQIFISGCSNLCAVAKGDGDYEKADKYFSLGLFTTLFLGLLQTVVFFLTSELYFGYFTASEEISAFAREYYKYYIFVPPFMAVATFFDEIAASDGDDMISYAGYLSSFAVNVGMSIVLSKIMGMGGLSLATMLSYVSFMLVCALHFLRKKNTYKLKPYFSFRDLFSFAQRSLKTNVTGLCMSAVSTAFTKAILLFWGSGYLIVNTVLCAMLEMYEIVNGPSEAAEYLFATYFGEKNGKGIKTLFYETMMACIFGGMVLALILLFRPDVVLLLYGIEDTPLRVDIIKCIRFCSVGMIAAAVGGFLGDYYGNIGKPFWSCMMVVFRTALFPILFCVTFCMDGGPVGMGKGMLLAQIVAIGIFYGFVLIVKGVKSIPYMLDDPDFEKVYMNSFTYKQEDYEEIVEWIHDHLKQHGISKKKAEEAEKLFLALCKKTEEKRGKQRVLGECVLRLIDEPEIIIKDDGELFEPDIQDESLSYNTLMACNSNTIRIKNTVKSVNDHIHNKMYQVSTLQALALGYSREVIKVKDLLKEGDTGLGTFEDVNGEMIAMDGQCFRADQDGNVSVVPPGTGVPFAAVAKLNGEQQFTMENIPDISSVRTELTRKIEERFGLNSMHVMRIDGVFEKVDARSEAPYRSHHITLKEMLGHTQKAFIFENIKGSLVGVYFPDYMDGINMPGWHLHFISEDRTKGGHVFDVSIQEGMAKVDKITNIYMNLPKEAAFDTYTLKQDLQAEIKSVE